MLCAGEMGMLPYKMSLDYLLTNAINYAFVFVLYVVVDYFFTTYGLQSFSGVFYAIALAALILGVKEQFWFLFWGERIAKCKRTYCLSFQDWRYIFQTSTLYAFAVVMSAKQGLYHWAPLEFTLSYYVRTVGLFYILQMLKDLLSLKFLHKWMHESKTLYAYHKEHHTVHKNAQNLMALHIDVIDLFLENLCAPVALQLILYLMGKSVSIHFGAMIFSTIMDIEIHAINPHTPCLFNPIFDYFFRCNIAHQIHHARQTENYMFIPYHHLDFQTTKNEMRRYDDIMKTNFFPEVGKVQKKQS